FLPYWILLKAAFSKAWAMPLDWDNFTVENFSYVLFQYSDTQRAILNTFKLGILTATTGTLLAMLIAYITNRNILRGARYLSFFSASSANSAQRYCFSPRARRSYPLSSSILRRRDRSVRSRYWVFSCWRFRFSSYSRSNGSWVGTWLRRENKAMATVSLVGLT